MASADDDADVGVVTDIVGVVCVTLIVGAVCDTLVGVVTCVGGVVGVDVDVVIKDEGVVTLEEGAVTWVVGVVGTCRMVVNLTVGAFSPDSGVGSDTDRLVAETSTTSSIVEEVARE